MMKITISIIALSVGLGLAMPASAACYADYKAKKTSPLQLHYGVVEVPDNLCANNDDVRNYIAHRISVGEWHLLNVMSVFGPEGLSQRQASAGNFYLKY